MLIEATAMIVLSCGSSPPRMIPPEAQPPTGDRLGTVGTAANAVPSGASGEREIVPNSDNLGAPANSGETPALAVAESSMKWPEVVATTESVGLAGMRSRPSGTVAAAAADEELQRWNIGGRGDSTHISNQNTYHPGTRVRVDAKLRLRRSKDGAELTNRVQAGLRSRGYWPFRNCYEEVARGHADPGGQTWLRITIGGNGSVLSARLLRTDLLHRKIAECQTRAARRLHIGALRVKRVDVDVTVAVWPGDVGLLPMPKVFSNTVRVDLPKMTRVITTTDAEVIECLRNARKRDPKLWGRLALSFALDDHGHPSNIDEYQSLFGDSGAVSCVERLLGTLEFLPVEPRDVRMVAAWRLHPTVPGNGNDSLRSSAEPAQDQDHSTVETEPQPELQQ